MSHAAIRNRRSWPSGDSRYVIRSESIRLIVFSSRTARIPEEAVGVDDDRGGVASVVPGDAVEVAVRRDDDPGILLLELEADLRHRPQVGQVVFRVLQVDGAHDDGLDAGILTPPDLRLEGADVVLRDDDLHGHDG